ncbi:MAG: acyltransferase family protein [Promethearchaeota archaeon]
MKMKRVISLDFIKGVAILGVIMFHATGFYVLDDVDNMLNSLDPLILIISVPLGMIGTWAGFFFLISGFLTVYTAYPGFKKGKNRKEIFLKGFITNIAIIVIHYIFVIFFMHSPFYGEPLYSLFTGSLVKRQLVGFSFDLLFYNSALFLIGIGGLVVNILTVCFSKWIIDDKNNRIYWIFTIIAFIIMIIFPFLESLLNPIITNNLDAGNYFFALLIFSLVGPRFGILPFIAYSLYGAVFGLMMVRNTPWSKIKKIGFILGAFYIFAGIISSVIIGIPDFSRPVFPINLNLLDLGVMLWIMTFAIRLFEFRTHKERLILVEKTKTIRKFGMLTLTIFVYDSLLEALVVYILDFIAPGIMDNIVFGVLVYIPLIMFLWLVILHFWERTNFKYSFEWLFAITVAKVSGRSSQKINFRQNLYNPIAEEAETNS